MRFCNSATVVWVVLSAAALVVAHPCLADKPAPIRISMSRTICFGSCPSYSVKLDGQGNATYVGDKFVKVTGTKNYTVKSEDVVRLADRIRKIDFFSLPTNSYDNCKDQWTDSPSVELEVELDGKKHSVNDDLGCRDSIWDKLREVEEQIDAVANTKQFVN